MRNGVRNYRVTLKGNGLKFVVEVRGWKGVERIAGENGFDHIPNESFYVVPAVDFGKKEVEKHGFTILYKGNEVYEHLHIERI